MQETENPIRVTLIDDSEDDILMMREALSVSPPLALHEVYESGVSALESMIKKHDASDLPNLILLDINMPRINGFEVLRKMKEHSRLRIIPTILLTTSNREEDVLMAYALGAASYIQKPFDFDELVDSTRKIAEYWSKMSLPKISLNRGVF